MFHVKQIDEWPQYLPFLNAELFHVKQSERYGEAEAWRSMFHVKQLHTQVHFNSAVSDQKKNAEALFE